MSNLRPTITTDSDKGQVPINWMQVFIKYDTDDKEETMRAKAKERKQCKVAEQAWQEEQAWLEAKKSGEGEEGRCKAKEEREAERKHMAEASAGATSSEAGGEVKKVVMDPGCTCCAQAKTVCKFLIDGNKKLVACIRCNQSKGKCQWPGDGKDTKASPKAGKVNEGKKQQAEKENAEARPSKQKQVKTSMRPIKVLDLSEPEAGGSRSREASAEYYLGLEEELKHLIDTVGLIANNLASLFELHEASVEN
ncbi:hypothetical protein M404DRAFT_28260 [Pisolithus tinctorius Marx 270]|uniref:Uncharacterized protein n=1 Tax=Pisolithus tinctorius Marx 270 TaxID=870435 RepID=A0A0C3P410_PISTI|nr:hypothetical protein M404DRAFT_28260 [Pisolithus tinctorius Marx 270]